MTSLITASIGIIKCKGKHYLQIIGAERYSFYLVPICIGSATELSESESLSIENFHSLPEATLIRSYGVGSLKSSVNKPVNQVT